MENEVKLENLPEQNSSVEEKPAAAVQTAQPKAEKQADEAPAKGSKYEQIGTWGFLGILLLLAIPIIGPILMIVWACGGCRKVQKRSFARAKLIMAGINLILSILLIVAAVQAVAGLLDVLELDDVGELGAVVESVVTGELNESSEEFFLKTIGGYMGEDAQLSEEDRAVLDDLFEAYLNGEVSFAD